MEAFSFSIILLAALLHAGWNALVKGGTNNILTSVLVSVFGGVLAIVALPLCDYQPVQASWVYLLISALLQAVYAIFLGYMYRISEMSYTYPLMRGTAPLAAALLGVTCVGEVLTWQGVAGIGLICLGILSMVWGKHQATGRGAALALVNALLIASYTLLDGQGIRLSQAPIAYILWLMLLQGGVLALWYLAVRRTEFLAYVQTDWKRGLTGGAGMVLSYGLALWAMTFLPIVLVAALRETSILFSLVISACFLREKIGKQKAISAGVIVAGVVVLRLAA